MTSNVNPMTPPFTVTLTWTDSGVGRRERTRSEQSYKESIGQKVQENKENSEITGLTNHSQKMGRFVNGKFEFINKKTTENCKPDKWKRNHKFKC